MCNILDSFCATTPEWAATLLAALQRSFASSVDSAVIQLLAAQMGAHGIQVCASFEPPGDVIFFYFPFDL
jgi:hypothetical protein